MLSESEWMYERQKLYVLMQEHPEWRLRSYARAVQHDLKWVRKWVKRFGGQDNPRLEMFRSQSHKPKHSPKQLSQQVKNKICTLREDLSERFHRSAGAQTIQYFLKQEVLAIPCASSIYKTLHERGYLQPRRKIEHDMLELPAPNEEWEMDFGEIYLGQSEGVIYLEGGHGYRAQSALEAIVRLFTRHGLPKRLRFDRDPRLWGSWTRDSYPSILVRMLRVLGVGPPRRPDKKPFVERCIRTLKYEWLARYSPTTFADALELLEPFIVYHNTQRPHQGQACHNEMPDIAYPHIPDLPALPQVVQPNRWLQAEHRRVYRRRVNANGSIQVDCHIYYIGQGYAGLAVLAQLDAERAQLVIIGDGKVLKRCPLMGLYSNELPFADYLEHIKAEAHWIEQYHYWHCQQTGNLF